MTVSVERLDTQDLHFDDRADPHDKFWKRTHV